MRYLVLALFLISCGQEETASVLLAEQGEFEETNLTTCESSPFIGSWTRGHPHLEVLEIDDQCNGFADHCGQQMQYKLDGNKVLISETNNSGAHCIPQGTSICTYEMNETLGTFSLYCDDFDRHYTRVED